ncbi:KAP family NTPase [Aeromonas schubertii]|uniref:KAP family NTPase n=1 Tax=Aeromonas schubertii TaxID=652 RepID=A0ABS7VF84_9GAMM|nr:KAP family NTPase [Aeromonas schubertii]MBZ6068052.1 KAP family NTPase [Aeromonas schubertii]
MLDLYLKTRGISDCITSDLHSIEYINSTENKKNTDFISAYLDKDSIYRYSLLLSGSWGSGKTHYIKSYIKANNKTWRESGPIYISLYGMSALEHVEDEILKCNFPFLKNPNFKLLAKVGNSALGAIGMHALDVNGASILTPPKNKIYVFDDVERSAIPLNDILGYVNNLVEHQDCKVILVADESVLEKNEQYKIEKEKVIGKTLTFNTSIKNALEAFSYELRSKKTTEFLIENITQIISFYKESKQTNLRIYQQSLWDFEGVYLAIEEGYANNNKAMLALFFYFIAVTTEIKLSRLSFDELPDARNRLLDYADNDKSGQNFKDMKSRYAMVNFDDPMLPHAAIRECLLNGYIDHQVINNHLATTNFFIKRGSEPFWKTLWHSDSRTDEDLDSALAELNKSLEDKSIVNEFVFKHVVGIKLQLVDIGIDKRNKNEVVSELIKYLQDVVERKLMKLDRLHGKQYFDDYYDSLGYILRHSPEFIAISDEIENLRDAARNNFSKDETDNLLALLTENSDAFNNELMDRSRYGLLPVLAAFDANEIVDALLQLHPSHMCDVLKNLKYRYEYGGEHLTRELPWLLDLKNALLSKDDISKFKMHAIERHIRFFIDPIISR